MRLSGWRRLAPAVLLLIGVLGCALPAPANPTLTAAAAKNTLDSWNPSYCKVAEFYGFHQPGASSATQVAYVLLTNPSDKAAAPVVYAAQFELLITPDGHPRWHLTSLVNHGMGFLTRRQGWDNLMIPVKEAAPAPAATPTPEKGKS